MDEKIIYEWDSVERPHKKWSKDLFSTAVVIAFLLSVIFFFIEGIVPVIVIWSIFFMSWAINRTVPVSIKKKLGSRGLYVGDDLYLFEEMKNYWVEKQGSEVLVRINVNKFPYQVMLVLTETDMKKIEDMMSERVYYQEPKQGFVDKIVKWFRSKVDLD
jgi:hypothetical protein